MPNWVMPYPTPMDPGTPGYHDLVPRGTMIQRGRDVPAAMITRMQFDYRITYYTNTAL